MPILPATYAIAVITFRLVDSRLKNVGLHHGWSDISPFLFANLMYERSRQLSSTLHMCKATNIMQGGSWN